MGRKGSTCWLATTVLVLCTAGSGFAASLGTVHGWGNYDVTGRPLGLSDPISLKAAAGYTYVLRSDHTIALWGNNGNGQCDAPPGLSNVTAIAAGYYAAMALTADGNVQVWGAGGHIYRNLIINPPASATNLVAIAAGMAHCLGLRSDGTVIAWGGNTFGEIDVPPGLSNVVQIAAGQDYSLAITSSGEVVTWGNVGFYGPVPADATNLVAVSLSPFGHGVALRADATVVAWGNTSSGQTTVPAGLSNVVAVAAGDLHSAALRSDGSLALWGDNGAGECVVPSNFYAAKAVAAGSHNTVIVSDAPLVEDISPDQYLTAGNDLTLQAFVTGSRPWVSAWLKDGVTLAQTNATFTLHDVQAADAGVYSFIASNEFGFTTSRGVSLYVNPSAPRWNEQPQNQAVPPGQSASFFANVSGSEPLQFQWFHDGLAVLGATNATLQISSVSTNDEGAYTVQVWNDYGSISNTPCFLASTLPRILSEPTNMRVRTNWSMSLDVSVLSSSPVDYRWFKDGVELIGAVGPSLAFPSVQATNAGQYIVEVSNQFGSVRSAPVYITILSNQSPPLDPGVVVEWGSAPFSSPLALSSETNVVGIAVGDWHTLVLRPDGTVRIWGNPQDFSLMDIPAAATNVSDVFAGPGYCLALRRDGIIVPWGGNSSAIGLSTSAPGNSNVVSAAAGPYGSVLLRADGSVIFFPDSVYVPTNVTNITAVAITSEYAAALGANGKVLIWRGIDAAPAIEVPGLNDVVAIAGGEAYSSVALRADGTVAEFSLSFPVPVWNLVPGITNAIAVAGGRGFMALLPTGQVISWETQYGNAPAGLAANRIAFKLLHQAAVTPAPYFDKQPQSQTFYAGGNGTLDAAIRSATPMTLQWYFEGAPVPNATNLVLPFLSARPSQSGHYKLVASNAKYTADSQIAIVSVEGPAEFVQISGDQNPRAGETLQLQVQYVANPPGSAQWRFNGFPIPNATNATLLLADAQEWMDGVYTLTVSNAYGEVSSPMVHVTVMPIAPAIVSQPIAPSQVPDGNSVNLQVIAIGSEPLAYQWFFKNVPMIGQTQPTLRLNSVSQSDNGSYRVTVTNVLGSTNSATVSVTSFRAAPSPQIQPQHLLVREGKTFQLIAVPGGTPGATYQWRFKGQDLAGETNAQFIVSTASLTNSGAYSVVAANAFGSNESPSAVIHILPNPGAGLTRTWGEIRGNLDTVLVEAVAQGAQHALALLPDGTLRAWGNNSYLQSTIPGGLSNAVAISAGQDFSLALRADGTVLGWGRNDAKQASPPADLNDIIAVSAGGDHALALSSDGSVTGWGNTKYTRIPTNLPPLISIAAGAGYSLGLAADGRVWAWGAPTLRSLTNVPASISNIVALAAGGTFACALDSSGIATSWPTAPLRPPDATNLIALACGSSHVVGLRADGKLFSWGSEFYGQITGARGVSNILSVAAGGQTTAAISAEPKILSTPIPTTRYVQQGGDISLAVNAVGTPPLAFLWFLDGQPLANGTNATFEIDSFDATNAGRYSIQVSNGFASVKSNIVTLALGQPPMILSQPTNQTVTIGSNATFSVQCSGTPSLLYQWALNGTNLFGATSSSLTLSNVLVQDQGSLSVTITNAFGAVVSQPALLQVVPPSVTPSQLSLGVSGGSLHFHLNLQPNRLYSLQSSTNLTNWFAVQNVTSPNGNLDLFLGPFTGAIRFYRLIDITP